MKRCVFILAAVGLCVTCLTASATNLTSVTPDEPEKLEAPANPAKMTQADWAAYCIKLEKALASETETLKLAALRLVIQYGDHMEFGPMAVYDAVRLHRDHANDRVRRMATVALLRMHNDWAFDFLERSIEFEKNEVIRKTMRAVLAERPSNTPRPVLAGTN